MTPQEAKQKAIIEAYGEYYDKWKEYIDDEGYLFNGGEHFFLSYGQCKGTPLEHCDYLEDVYLRPMSLRGLEDNRGWTLIDPDGSNLPDKTAEYYVIRSGECEKALFYTRTGFWSVIGIFYNKTFNDVDITHFKPFEQPALPIY